MSKLMKEISKEEISSLLNQFQRKTILIDMRTADNCIYVFNYKQFTWSEDEEYIRLMGLDENEELSLLKENIVEYSKLDSESIWHEVIEFSLNNGNIISLCVLYKPRICSKCDKELNEQHEQIWNINQVGGYYSACDSERISKDFCDQCLQEFIQ